MQNFADDDEGVIDLRAGDSDFSDTEFQIHSMEKDEEFSQGPESNLREITAHDRVKVKFDKFVNLIATHAYEEIFDKYNDEDVIVSTDLLADLANAHEEKQMGKTPFLFLFGILLGIVATYFLMKA